MNKTKLMNNFDAEELLQLCKDLVRIPSETPPGDTRDLANYIFNLFAEKNLPVKLIAPQEEMPNIICTIEGSRPGKHLVYNGHLDIYPANNHQDWDYPPYDAVVKDGKLYGRGVADMKVGVAASIYSFLKLAEFNDFPGKISITLVSDEQTGGKWGTDYVLKKFPELRGDALLNGEPSSCSMVSIGEKGTYWIRLNATNLGGHGAYAHEKNSAIHNLLDCIADLKSYVTLSANIPVEIRGALKNTKDTFEEIRGRNSFEAVMKYSMNVGTIKGGNNVNTQSATASAEIDFRIPPGGDMEEAKHFIHQIIDKHPNISYEVMKTTKPTLSTPSNPLLQAVKRNAEEIRGEKTVLCFTFGATDARFWRLYNVAAAVYGPNHHNMGAPNEYVYLKDIETVGRVHLAASIDYLNHQEYE